MPRFTSRTPVISIPKKGFEELMARGFEVRVRGKIVQGILVKKGGRYFAYQNLCKHLAVTLDLKDENFFTHNKEHMQCHMHGAMYEIETGLCVAGPCQGARLSVFEVSEDPTRVIVKVPDDAVLE